ncbi:hypothetical protein [Oceanirhabdus sp. W0125-5]|uniref:hypothetical protein n=1 Tax=Oceanirhabdus sp. W0125-5 TaxID=2999116 RepID=UPI0022F2F9B1|nr:hypothetical protein [Oceanirhabdus sp. W0125-5]WBW95171.1 hypothetical protein OW730_15920 [Oceanirhabdus sp. W0125-5]
MREKIFKINYFDKQEMLWFQNKENIDIKVDDLFKLRQEHRYEHSKWYHETGTPPIEAHINSFPDEFVQLPPLLPYEEFKEYIPIKENENATRI